MLVALFAVTFAPKMFANISLRLGFLAVSQVLPLYEAAVRDGGSVGTPLAFLSGIAPFPTVEWSSRTGRQTRRRARWRYRAYPRGFAPAPNLM